MDAQLIALTLVGLIQAPLQELLFRNHVDGRGAVLATIGVSAALALVAVWLTGGLAGGTVPAFTLADPSPLLAFVVVKLAPVYALSQIVFGLFSKEIHDIARTVPTPA